MSDQHVAAVTPASTFMPTSQGPGDPGRAARELLIDSLPLIERTARRLAHSGGLAPQDVEEFEAWAKLRLLENDCRIVRRFSGKGSWRAYLRVALGNLLRDFRNHLWGKYRPSAAARRHGDAAIKLEKLVVRDGVSRREAVRIVGQDLCWGLAADDLRRLAGLLPERTRRSFVGTEALTLIPAADRADGRLSASRRKEVLLHAARALAAALGCLDDEDRALLELHFKYEWTIAQIARAWHRPQRRLYTQRDRALRDLRNAFVLFGGDCQALKDLLSDPGEGVELEVDVWGPRAAKRPPAQPSAESTIERSAFAGAG